MLDGSIAQRPAIDVQDGRTAQGRSRSTSTPCARRQHRRPPQMSHHFLLSTSCGTTRSRSNDLFKFKLGISSRSWCSSRSCASELAEPLLQIDIRDAQLVGRFCDRRAEFGPTFAIGCRAEDICRAALFRGLGSRKVLRLPRRRPIERFVLRSEVRPISSSAAHLALHSYDQSDRSRLLTPPFASNAPIA
jgi:hypothetical protein